MYLIENSPRSESDLICKKRRGSMKVCFSNMLFQREAPYQGHGGHSIWSGTWPITRGVGSSSGTNSCFQIQPLFRRRCRWVDPWASCWASKPWVPLISLSTPPGIIEKTVTTAKTLGVLILTVHPCVSSALPMVSGQEMEVSVVCC